MPCLSLGTRTRAFGVRAAGRWGDWAVRLPVEAEDEVSFSGLLFVNDFKARGGFRRGFFVGRGGYC